jgi:hypothetical protein
MRNFTRMGSVAVSAAFLSIAAQSAASAQGNPNVNPNVERAVNRAAQVNPDVERDTTQQQTTHRRSTQLTVNVPRTIGGIPFDARRFLPPRGPQRFGTPETPVPVRAPALRQPQEDPRVPLWQFIRSLGPRHH